VRCLTSFLLVAGLIAGCSAGGDANSKRGAGSPATTQTATRLPSDWREFTVDGVRLWLPPEFEGGEFGDERDATIQRIAALGGTCLKASRGFALIDNVEFLAVDSTGCDGKGLPTLTVDSADVPAATSAQEHLEAVLIAPRGSDFGDWQKLPESSDAGRIVVHNRAADGRLVAYAIRSESRVWVVQLITSASEFDRRLQEMDQAVLAFEASLPY
jgi:hypothetical protein